LYKTPTTNPFPLVQEVSTASSIILPEGNFDGQRCDTPHLPVLSLCQINYKSFTGKCQCPRPNYNSFALKSPLLLPAVRKLFYLSAFGELLSVSSSRPPAATAPKFQVESPTFSLRTLIKMLVVLSINQKDYEQ
jgi:hypothetical protein